MILPDVCLPFEMIVQITLSLTPRDLIECSKVSEDWKEWATDGYVWKRQYMRRYGGPKPERYTWLTWYKICYRAEMHTFGGSDHRVWFWAAKHGHLARLLLDAPRIWQPTSKWNPTALLSSTVIAGTRGDRGAPRGNCSRQQLSSFRVHSP